MPQNITINGPELIGGLIAFFSLVGAGFTVAKKNGWLTIGRPVERRQLPSCDFCTDHKSLVDAVDDMKADVRDIKDSVASIDKNLAEHLGYHKGHNGTI